MSILLFRHRQTGSHANRFGRLLLAIPTVGILLFFPPSVQAAVSQQQRDALIALFNNLGGINWINKTGWLGLPGSECSWYGVTCDTTMTSVTGLDLSQNGLLGSIPAEISGLTNLQILSLNGNYIGGVPDAVSSLMNLRVLELGDTDIWGIPSGLGNLSQLQILHMSGRLQGTIPPELGTLKQLKSLRLISGCGSHLRGLSGNIPVELGSLTNLEVLELVGSLEGGIPAELGNLTELKVLNLTGTCAGLGGTIPASLANLRNLQSLRLRQNALVGDIPPSLLDLVNLQELDLGVNYLSSIPAEIGRLTNLQVLDWSGNGLRSIPAELGTLTNLRDLELGSNPLGSIPAELMDLGNLQTLGLSSTQLSRITAELGKLASLQTLDLSSNDLSGFPVESGDLPNLQTLKLQYNQLTADGASSLHNLRNLQLLCLSHNQLEGIPAGIGNLRNLILLDLSFNQLTGGIPAELGNLANLQYLSLPWNQLSGSIPTELGNLMNLVGLFLGGNKLSGSIPIELGNLANLWNLDLSSNQLSGSIPIELGKLANLVSLSLSGNQLSGSIPVELGNLKNLVNLDLNFNQLSGNIPSSLGNLTNLDGLYLAGNKLSGSIPLSLSNLKSYRIEIGYNALHADDYGLLNFLGSAAFGWDRTQTVAPSNVFAVLQSDPSILVSWQPIPFTDFEGRYEVWMSRNSGGPYELVGSTEDKRASSLLLPGLSPGTYLVVRTVTDPHDNNQNTVISEYSAGITVDFPKVSVNLTLNDTGAASSATIGNTDAIQTGYATVTLSQDIAPYATAVYSYRQNGVTVSEAGVPVSPPTTAARIFVDYRTETTIPGSEGSVDIYSGLAVANRGDGPAMITFTLRDVDAQIIATGISSLAKDAHFASYIHQLPDILHGFSIPASFPTSTGLGMLDLTSDQLLSVVALRLTINQRGETLLTTTPVVDLTRPSTATPLYFPQLADGGGYTTSLILMNTTSSIETGRLSILADDGSALPVRQLNGASGSSFPYLILPGAVYVFQTDASPDYAKTGWVELTPGGGTPAPAAAAIFQYSRNGILLTESGVPPAHLTTHARVFVDLSGGHDTGLALCNPGYTRLDISLTAYQMDGISQVGKNQWPVSLRGRGHTAAFVDQLISYLPADFRGVLDIASDSPFAALTLRSLVNERFEFLLTTFPVADVHRPAPFPVIFPLIADGEGYRTEFILISAGLSGGATIAFFDDEGTPLAIGH